MYPSYAEISDTSLITVIYPHYVIKWIDYEDVGLLVLFILTPQPSV